MFATVLACILGLLVTASHGDEDGFVAFLVQERADCANGDEYNKGTGKSLQQCANACGNDDKVFFSYGANFDPTRCWCAGEKNNEDSTRCGWDDSPGGYNVYVAMQYSVGNSSILVYDVDIGEVPRTYHEYFDKKYYLLAELSKDLASIQRDARESDDLWEECGEALQAGRSDKSDNYGFLRGHKSFSPNDGFMDWTCPEECLKDTRCEFTDTLDEYNHEHYKSNVRVARDVLLERRIYSTKRRIFTSLHEVGCVSRGGTWEPRDDGEKPGLCWGSSGCITGGSDGVNWGCK